MATDVTALVGEIFGVNIYRKIDKEINFHTAENINDIIILKFPGKVITVNESWVRGFFLPMVVRGNLDKYRFKASVHIKDKIKNAFHRLDWL